MYMSIWWLGVMLSNRYMAGEEISVKSLAGPLSGILVIFLICGLGVYRASIAGTLSGMGIHPILEMRDHFSAIAIVIIAVLWKAQKWIFFDQMVKPFLFFAPISYVLYISHHYFVVDAHYFSFMKNKAVEFSAYMLLLMAFSYVIEIIVYPRMLKKFSVVLTNPGRAH
jgi:hypothetical protein